MPIYSQNFILISEVLFLLDQLILEIVLTFGRMLLRSHIEEKESLLAANIVMRTKSFGRLN